MSASITHTAWLKASETRALIDALEGARPGGSRFVGGCVRNALLGLAIDDIDIATQLTPDQVTALARKAGFGAIPTGIEHGTVTVIVERKAFEVTTLRRDVSTDGRRAIVAFTEDWAEDSARRDFRLNALYASPDGEVFDPTGGGLDDARAGRVMFVGDPESRIGEDFLRILRFFRFNAWYGRAGMDAAGLAACVKLRDGLRTLSAERVWMELKKLFRAERPLGAYRAMAEAGVGGVVLPEAANHRRLAGLLALEQEMLLAGDPLTRVAAGLEDQAGALALAVRLKLSNGERERLLAALGAGERMVSYLSPREVRRALYRLGREAFTDRVMLQWAEENGAKAAQWRALLALAQAWERPKLPLSGDEVMAAGVAAGPKVGDVLREVEAWWIDSDFPDDRLSIAERLKAVVQGLS